MPMKNSTGISQQSAVVNVSPAAKPAGDEDVEVGQAVFDLGDGGVDHGLVAGLGIHLTEQGPTFGQT